jgi:hypothetical protein
MNNLGIIDQFRLDIEKVAEETDEIDRYENAPIYVRIFDSLEDYTKLNRYFLYLLISLLPFLIYQFLATLCNWEKSIFTDYWIRLNFSGWTFGCFLFMNYIYNKSVNIFPLLSYLADTPYNKHRLRILYDTVFTSKSQNVVYLITAVLTTTTGVYLGLELDIAPKVFIILSSFLAGYIIGFGLWYSFGLAFLIHSIGKMKNVKINYLNPTYSIGVFEIPRLSSAWSMCFFGEAIIVYVGLLFTKWAQHTEIVSTIQLFWLSIFLILSVFNFINPIAAVSKLTNEAKTRFKLTILNKLHRRLSDIENDIDSLGQHYQEIKLIEEFYEKVSIAKSYIFDWAVFFRFLATTIPAALIIFLENHEVFVKLFNLFNQGK